MHVETQAYALIRTDIHLCTEGHRLFLKSVIHFHLFFSPVSINGRVFTVCLRCQSKECVLAFTYSVNISNGKYQNVF